MKIVAAALVMAAACAAVPAFGDGYSPEWCAANRDNDRASRNLCADVPWCAVHWNDDRETRLTCDPFRSKADGALPMPHMTRAMLDAGPFLSREQVQSACFAESGCSRLMVVVQGEKAAPGRDRTMLPPGVTAARLALRGDIEFGYAGVMHVRIALMNGREGVLWINGKKYGSRQTRLSPAEIGSLVDAINRAQFWRLPTDGGHRGVLDGMLASVEISVPGRQHHVSDFIGWHDAVDLSVLVNAITPIVFAHWKGI